MFNSLLHNYFGFNRQQRNGLFVLIVISFLLLIIRITYPYFLKPEQIVIKNLPLLPQPSSSQKHASGTYENKQQNAQLFVFDPNTVNLDQLLKLGFSDKTAHALINFRNKGFVFRQKEDLKKVYGVKDDLYLRLEPYIHLSALKPKNNTPSESKPVEHTSSRSKIIELNACDSTALVSLPGIGPAYAKRIIKYRTILGGFTNAEQLKEVYGFSEDLYNTVKNSFSVDTRLIKKIDLNKDDFKTINKHPYLSYELTGAIFNLRRKTPVTVVNLKELMTDEVLYNKLLPYLNFGQ